MPACILPSQHTLTGRNTPGSEESNVEIVEELDENAAEDGEPSFESVSSCVSAYYQDWEFGNAREGLFQQVERAMGSQRSKIASFKKRLEEARTADTLKVHGEALLANQYLVKAGASQVEVPDYAALSEGDEEVPLMRITVDPTMSVADNAARLFKRYKKLVRQQAASEQLLVEASHALTELIHAQEALANVPQSDGPAGALEALRSLEESLVSRGLLKRRADDGERLQRRAQEVSRDKAESRGKSKIKVRGRGKAPDFMRFQTPSGLEVVAGKSSRQNDRVTWGLARDHHLWFHARGIGGSHVVLLLPRLDKGGGAAKEDIIFAARIAAFYSKARADTRVDVSYTERRHLRQPPQRYRKPGMVMITREEVVTVAPSDCAEFRIG
jgi:predicted ribosome quality control (RQC) complex YloA/Tae2 family protein